MRTIEREIVGAFIFSNDDYFLIGENQSGGVYQGLKLIPGGGVNAGESLVEALKREVHEEVSLDISDAKISLINDDYGQSEKTLKETGERVLVHMHFNNFRIDIDKPAAEIQAKAADDFTNTEWVAISKLARIHFSPPTIRALTQLGYL